MGNFIKYKRQLVRFEMNNELDDNLNKFFDSIIGDGSEIIYYNEHNTSEVKQVQTPTGIQDVTKTFLNITVVVGRRNQVL